MGSTKTEPSMGLPTSEKEEKEKNKRKRTEEEIEKANKRVKKIPLRHKLRDQLIERLQNTNKERTDTENIAGLPKLLYKEKEKNDIEEIISERKETKRFRCENCDEIINGKAQLTRHTKKRKECEDWYERDKISYKFCYKGECNFHNQKQEIVDRHTEMECDGKEREIIRKKH